MSERTLLIHENQLHLARQLALAAGFAVGPFEPHPERLDHIMLRVSHASLPDGADTLTILHGTAWKDGVCCVTAMIGPIPDLMRLSATAGAKITDPDGRSAQMTKVAGGANV